MKLDPTIWSGREGADEIQKGVIHANIGNISNYLNASSPPNAPLKNISIQPEGDQLGNLCTSSASAA